MSAPFEIDADGFTKRQLSRYMSFGRFSSLLEKGLYLPKVSQFEDRWEGLLGVQLRERMRKEKGTRYGFGPSDYEEGLNWIHVSCWNDGVQEDAVMWRGYGGSPDSVMVHSSAAKLERLYRSNPECFVAYMNPVTYHVQGSEPTTISLPSLIAPWGNPRPSPSPGKPDLVDLLPELFSKYSPYQGEKEFRLVALNKRYKNDVTEAEGFFMKFEPSTHFLDRVIVSPNASDQDFDQIQEMCASFDSTLSVQRSKILLRASRFE